ncbi:hypothetical protein CBL_20313, partial [Carabus blaptoides fortunei]
QELNYLGHKISHSGIEPGEHKIEAIIDITPPTNKKSLENFLSMDNYLSIYINESHKDAFLQLKQAIINPPVLKYFDPKENIVLSVVASQHGSNSTDKHTDPQPYWVICATLFDMLVAITWNPATLPMHYGYRIPFMQN